MLALSVPGIGALGKLGHALGRVLVLLVLITVLTMVSGRLLGIRLRWWRALVAGFPGIVMGYTFSWAVNGYRRPPVFTPQSVWPVAMLGTMVVAVVMELLGRPGRPGRLAGVQARLIEARQLQVSNPVRAVRRRLARTRRYLEVTRIAARHGLGPYLGMGRREPPDPRPDLDAGAGAAATPGERADRRRVARRLRRALEEGGGMFVKLGQVLSTRTDLLPPEVIAELSGLLDDVAPPPRSKIEALLAAELGAEPTEVFAEFDAEPLAAASIAQVYRARLRSGEPVVVKVQRPGIRELVERDLDILLRLARTLEARAAWARDAHAVELAGGFAEALTEELDFRVEARNIAAVAASMVADSGDGDAAVLLPEVHAGLSTDRVLVLGQIDGSNVRDAGPLLERLGADRQRLARGLLRALLRQILDGGTFHADPHPANVFVTPDGRLALLDFGSVGRLDPLEQAGLRRVLLAVHRRDATGLTDAILEIVQVRDRADEALLERALAHFMARHLGPGMMPDATMFTVLFQLLLEFGIAFPPELGAVFRALVTLEGTLNLLAPGFKLIDETQALAGEWLRETFQPATLRKAAADELLAVLPILRRLPRRVDRIATAAEGGTFSVNVRLFADQRDVRVAGGMVDRAVLAFLGGILGIMSVLLVTSTIGPRLGPTVTVLQFFGYVGLFLSVCLILRVSVAIARGSR